MPLYVSKTAVDHQHPTLPYWTTYMKHNLGVFSRFKLRPIGMANPALPEGGSTGGTTATNPSPPTPVAPVHLRIRTSCTGGNSNLPNTVTGLGPSGVAEVLAKELLAVHPEPQRLTRAMLTAASGYSNVTTVQVIINFYICKIFL